MYLINIMSLSHNTMQRYVSSDTFWLFIKSVVNDRIYLQLFFVFFLRSVWLKHTWYQITLVHMRDLNKQLSKQRGVGDFETPLRSLWHRCNGKFEDEISRDRTAWRESNNQMQMKSNQIICQKKTASTMKAMKEKRHANANHDLRLIHFMVIW